MGGLSRQIEKQQGFVTIDKEAEMKIKFKKGQMVTTLDEDSVGVEMLAPFDAVPVDYLSYLDVMETAVKEFTSNADQRLEGYEQ